MNPFWHNIFRISGYEQSLAYFLGTVPVFGQLKKKELEILENIVHLRTYQTDELIFSEGDVGSGMYVIRSGQVQIFSADEEAQVTEHARLEPGDFFGETALTASRPRCAGARATEPTVLVGLFRSDVDEALQRHPALMAKTMYGLNRVVSDRLLQSYLQLEELKKQRTATPQDEGS